jgi:hypothetical protein
VKKQHNSRIKKTYSIKASEITETRTHKTINFQKHTRIIEHNVDLLRLDDGEQVVGGCHSGHVLGLQELGAKELRQHARLTVQLHT